MNEEPFFKALSRTPMIFGVPLMPLIVMGFIIFMLAIFINFILVLLLIPAFAIMRILLKRDDKIFELFAQQFKFRGAPAKGFFKTKTFIAAKYEPNKAKNNLTKLSICGLKSLYSISQYIPFSAMISDGIISTKNFDYIATFSIDGINFEIEDDDDLEAAKNKINIILRAMSGGDLSFYFHNCRLSKNDSLSGNFPNKFLQNFDERYYRGIGALKENRMFLSVIYSPLKKAETQKFKKLSVDEKREEIKKHILDFKEILQSIKSGLNSFGTHQLKSYEDEKGPVYSEQLEFYNLLLGGEYQKIRINDTLICDLLQGGMEALFFCHNSAQITLNNGQKKFFKAIEIKEFPNFSWVGMLDNLMYQDAEYIITHSFTPIAKYEAQSAISHQRTRLLNVDDDAVSQLADIDLALDELIGGEICFGDYHFSLVVYASSPKELDEKANLLISKMADQGFLSTVANIALPATYFSQIPSNFQFRPRVYKLSSKNFASLIALHNFSRGKRSGNSWGDAVTMLRTPNGAPYYFNFHEDDGRGDNFGKIKLANTLILGRSGSGKTVLMGFLLNQLAKFTDPKTFPEDLPEDKKKATFFFLDKDHGALGNVMAQGGKYIDIKAGTPTGFNPFMCDATNENIRKLQVLIKLLITRNGERLSSHDEEVINFAVLSIMKNFAKEDRKFPISLMLEHLTEDAAELDSVRARLSLWSKEKQFGWVFDNEVDSFSLDDECHLFAVDGTDLLRDDDISAPVAFYILWRIFEKCDGRRFALFVDEAWDWLRNDVVAKEIENKEKTIRKLNGFLCLGTQSVEDFANTSIATALIEQSATILLLSNSKAKEQIYCDTLKLSSSEFYFVSHTPPEAHQVLIKKATEKAVALFNLGGLGSAYIKTISTSADYADELLKINELNITKEEKQQRVEALYGGF